MRVQAALSSLLFMVASGSGVNAYALEIWLARTDSCNACGIYEELAQARGYDRALKHQGAGTIPIRFKDKANLPAAVLEQLHGESGPGNPHWSVQLTVLVMDGEIVRSFGNIAESADINVARISSARMFPPSRPPAGHPALGEQSRYREFFLAHWNLEFFLERALGGANQSRQPLINLEAQAPAKLAQANVILWGSAATPLANAQFISERIAWIRAKHFASKRADSPKVTVIYGHGPNASGNDTSALVNGRVEFLRSSLTVDYNASEQGLSRVLTAIAQSGNSNNLLIQVGHSASFGSPLWGRLAPITAKDLAAAHLNKPSSVVMVSGACNSGLFASAVDCGFFAAHPEVLAAGCQKSREAISQSHDYLRYFFDASKAQGADANNDGAISMEEAHWFASTRVEDHQITYTRFDALADRYYEGAPEQLPAQLSITGLRELTAFATPAERHAMRELLAGLPENQHVPLHNYVQLNHVAQAKLHAAAELPSTERNAITGMPYKLMLVALARRLLYRQAAETSARSGAVAACEAQTIDEYLAGAVD